MGWLGISVGMYIVKKLLEDDSSSNSSGPSSAEIERRAQEERESARRADLVKTALGELRVFLEKHKITVTNEEISSLVNQVSKGQANCGTIENNFLRTAKIVSIENKIRSHSEQLQTCRNLRRELENFIS